jgi:hypothetical protein
MKLGYLCIKAGCIFEHCDEFVVCNILRHGRVVQCSRQSEKMTRL